MQHEYLSRIVWTGNRGAGTAEYRGYDRTWDIAVEGKHLVHCSNDPLLGGDRAKHNPEDLILSALSSCHMLWYLHLAAESGVVVHSYEDRPVALGEVERGGAGRFLSAILRPQVLVARGTNLQLATELHHRVHKFCFIARSVNFPITYEPEFQEQ